MTDNGKLIYAKIAELQARIGAVGKTRRNTQQGYSFRGIADVYMAVHPLLAELKLFSVPELIDIQREERTSKSGGVLTCTIVKVKYTVYAEDGSSIWGITPGEGMDSGDKSVNKAMAGSHKYFWVQTLNLPEEESPDSENDSPEVAPKVMRPTSSENGPRPIKDSRQDTLAAIGRVLTKSIHDATGIPIFAELEVERCREWCKAKDAKALAGLLTGLEGVRDERYQGKRALPTKEGFVAIEPDQLVVEVF